MFATKYRPNNFAGVVGQNAAVSALKKIAASPGISARSILVIGSYGSGKTTMSRIFAKAVNCEKFKETGDVCNECEGCKQAERANSRHYLEFDSTRIGSVDAIRSLESVFGAAVQGRRVITIDEIHTASTQAQSYLLKTLEEGIPNTFFMFCTTDSVLETIRSRSIELPVSVIPHQLIKDRVRQIMAEESIVMTEQNLDILAIKSRGHMRDALGILQLYEMIGEEALTTPLFSLRKFLYYCLTQKPVDQVIDEILRFSSNEIAASVSVLVKGLYISSEKMEVTIRQKGMANRIFEMFYSPSSQQALKSELGVEILLRSINERLKPRQ